jgi:hypothetical protein
MPIPAAAVRFTQIMDPSDILDFHVAVSQGGSDAIPPPILLFGESIASLQLAVTAESAAVGLQIKSGGAYPAPAVTAANTITFWTAVAPEMQTSPIFDGDGVEVALELVITTNNSPPRRKQRTLVFKIANL